MHHDNDADASSTARRATQLPKTWEPNDTHREFATKNLISIDDEVDQFRDHHTARGSTMKNWDAAFSTWLRNEKKFKAKRGQALTPARPLPHVDDIAQPPDGLTDEQYRDWWDNQRSAR